MTDEQTLAERKPLDLFLSFKGRIGRWIAVLAVLAIFVAPAFFPTRQLQ